MLLQFTVGNYRSFRDKTTFSLVAEPDERGHENTLIDAQKAAGVNVLSLGVLYGANASGKSNLLKAIRTLRELVTEGGAIFEPTPVDRFLLGGDSFADTEPTFLETHFVFNDEMYCYGVECDARYIRREWLRFGREETPLFDRFTDEDGTVSVENYAELARMSKMEQRRVASIAERTRANQPFLTQAAERNVAKARDIVFYIQHHFVLVTPDARNSSALVAMDRASDSPHRLGDFLRSAGTGINSVELHYAPFNVLELPEEEGRDVQTHFYYNEGSYVTLDFHGESITLKEEPETQGIVRVLLRARHLNESGSEIAMDWSCESDGTRRMAELWQFLFVNTDKGTCFFIDEVERSLHPELMRYILEQWRTFAPADSQMIFTTHNDNFLEDDLLRRDEVWFVSKDQKGVSSIVSETQYKPVEGVTRQRAYLDGMYGGIPHIPNRKFYSVPRDSEH